MEKDIKIFDIPLTIKYEEEEYDAEPYSYGYGRGKVKDTTVYEVLLGGHNIMDLLSEDVMERIYDEI